MLQQAAASGSADAVLRAGAAALQSGVHVEAVAAVEHALRSHDDNARLWQLLGLLHRNLEDLAPAIAAFAKAAELLPDDAIIEPKPGRLVLFPSIMWHGTRPFGAGERLTGFDVRRPGSSP
jgi:tetratricopeptide (TPR) repeat protein